MNSEATGPARGFPFFRSRVCAPTASRWCVHPVGTAPHVGDRARCALPQVGGHALAHVAPLELRVDGPGEVTGRIWERGVGPTLASGGIVNPLLDPTIELHDGNGAVIGFNDDWKDGQTQPLFATQLNPTNDREAAIVAFLAPGNYTAVVRGRGDTIGVALVEAYRVP